MYTKRKFRTGEISYYKQRIMLMGQQEQRFKFCEKYTPICDVDHNQAAAHITSTQGWASRQLDIVMAIPQSNVDEKIFEKILRVFMLPRSAEESNHVLNIFKSIHGLKQAGQVWNQHLHKSITK